MQQVELGTVSHGTMRVQDLLPAFLDTLSQLDPAGYSKLILDLDAEYQRSKTPVGIACYAGGYCKGLDLCDDDAWWSSERADELLIEVFDALDELAPKGARFGNHVGDGSDFGFWPAEDDCEQCGALILKGGGPHICLPPEQDDEAREEREGLEGLRSLLRLVSGGTPGT